MAETLGALLLQRPGQKPQWHTADAGGPMLGAADLPGEAAAGGSAGAGGWGAWWWWCVAQGSNTK